MTGPLSRLERSMLVQALVWEQEQHERVDLSPHGDEGMERECGLAKHFAQRWLELDQERATQEKRKQNLLPARHQGARSLPELSKSPAPSSSIARPNRTTGTTKVDTRKKRKERRADPVLDEKYTKMLAPLLEGLASNAKAKPAQDNVPSYQMTSYQKWLKRPQPSRLPPLAKAGAELSPPRVLRKPGDVDTRPSLAQILSSSKKLPEVTKNKRPPAIDPVENAAATTIALWYRAYETKMRLETEEYGQQSMLTAGAEEQEQETAARMIQRCWRIKHPRRRRTATSPKRRNKKFGDLDSSRTEELAHHSIVQEELVAAKMVKHWYATCRKQRAARIVTAVLTAALSHSAHNEM